MTYTEQVYYLYMTFVFWLCWRMFIHNNKDKITETILIYAPLWIPRCPVCIWYNIGVIEGVLIFLVLKTLS